MARSEGQRFAKTSALAAEFIINIAPGARLDLISSAILRITPTSFVGSDGMSIWPRLDSRACAERAAFSVPQGPSHHHRKEPAVGAWTADSFDGFDSILAALSSL